MSAAIPRLSVYPSTFSTLVDAVRIDPGAAAGSARLKGVEGHEPGGLEETCFLCFWDQRSLYVLFSVSGSPAFHRRGLIGPSETVCTPLLWELSEVVEVFVGSNARGTRRYREYEVAPDGRWIVLDVEKDSSGVRGKQVATGFRCAVERLPGGVWRAAMEIPWSEIGGKNPVCHANFYRSVPGKGAAGLYAWNPTDFGPQCFHRPDRFGDLEMVPR